MPAGGPDGGRELREIARFGTKKLALLHRFRAFADGTSSHDQLGDIFATLDAEKFKHCFIAWVASLTGAPARVIAIDGKTVRRSYQGKGRKAAIHMVSAFAARQRLVLGHVKVTEKSNEIVTIPKLLDILAIDGAIVTIDAMGCQRAIARKIIDKGADYVLALKDSQGTLREEIDVFVEEQKAKPLPARDDQPGATAITAASKPARQRSSTTLTGSATAMTGPV